VKSVKEKLNVIPNDAVISAQSPFVAQLAYRDNIYQFPIVKDAEYIIYSTHEDSYPLTKEKFTTEIEKISNSKLWVLVYKNDGMFIYKKSQ